MKLAELQTFEVLQICTVQFKVPIQVSVVVTSAGEALISVLEAIDTVLEAPALLVQAPELFLVQTALPLVSPLQLQVIC